VNGDPIGTLDCGQTGKTGNGRIVDRWLSDEWRGRKEVGHFPRCFKSQAPTISALR
jgi:hypothetical protein